MLDFEEVKGKLMEISEILEKYPEQLQPKVFDVLLQYMDIDGPLEEENNSDNINDNSSNQRDKKTRTAKRSKQRTVSKEVYQISKNLDLSGAGGKKAFKDFYKEKKPRTNIEFNVVAIYYLSKIMKLTNITIDDIYTCYKTVDKRVPSALKQSLIDTSGPKYGYISAENNTYLLPTRGENFVEHELPRTKKK